MRYTDPGGEFCVIGQYQYIAWDGSVHSYSERAGGDNWLDQPPQWLYSFQNFQQEEEQKEQLEMIF